MEVPAIEAMRSPRASISSITPICASPRAPPDPSTSPIRGAPPPSSMSTVVVGQGQREQRARLLAQRRGLEDLGVGAVMQHVHQQLARVAVGHLQLVAAVGQPAALLLRIDRKSVV